MVKFSRILEKCAECGRLLAFGPKMYQGVGQGVAYSDGRLVSYCAKCSYEQFIKHIKEVKKHESSRSRDKVPEVSGGYGKAD